MPPNPPTCVRTLRACLAGGQSLLIRIGAVITGDGPHARLPPGAVVAQGADTAAPHHAAVEARVVQRLRLVLAARELAIHAVHAPVARRTVACARGGADLEGSLG
jgi:hypothetical protein